MSSLTNLTLAEARDALKKREASATDMAKAFLDAMEAARSLNAYVLETPEQALAMAAQSDEFLARGEGRPSKASHLASKTFMRRRVCARQPRQRSLVTSCPVTNRQSPLSSGAMAP